MATIARIDSIEESFLSQIKIKVRNKINEWALPIFKVASYATDPVCSLRDRLIISYTINDLYPSASCVRKCAIKALNYITMFFAGLVSIPLSPLGIMLRSLGCRMKTSLFDYQPGEAQEMDPGDLTMESSNSCGVQGGYNRSDGGVENLSGERLNNYVAKLLEPNKGMGPKLLNLYEVFNVKTALELIEKLKKYYAHFYFNIGPRAAGISSGMFVASKCKITNFTFIPFPKAIISGRTQGAEKGVIYYDVGNVRIYSTHLQQSEYCAYPNPEEIFCRSKEIEFILELIKQEKQKTIILTGDLNVDIQRELKYVREMISKLENLEKTARDLAETSGTSSMVGDKDIHKAMETLMKQLHLDPKWGEWKGGEEKPEWKKLRDRVDTLHEWHTKFREDPLVKDQDTWGGDGYSVRNIPKKTQKLGTGA